MNQASADKREKLYEALNVELENLATNVLEMEKKSVKLVEQTKTIHQLSLSQLSMLAGANAVLGENL
ncbi:hypothetical protein AYI70_g7457 [Smittium culicis]|uniref:Uncharacterized protein n=1 Tax=Smittium culicis TaxID=133412 RepID=A0A1R1XKM5_9FUNG|nr:hypothetical protein AYI70_g7457 [Smittium culicis]